MVPKDFMEANKNDLNKLEEFRQRELDSYRHIVSLMDGVIVSTEELKRSLYPYNKNIIVLENNLEEVPPYKSYDPEEAFVKISEGSRNVPPGEKFVDLEPNMGVFSVPSYCASETPGNIQWTPRVGYSSTVTHWGGDFNTVIKPWEKLITKHSRNCWFVYLGGNPAGWNNFVNWHIQTCQNNKVPHRLVGIPDSQYSLYMMNLRNLDIAIAPLAPNVFNMAKSDLKPVEYGANSTCPILPNYVTYTRHWKHEENCLIYSNEREFYECVEAAINDVNLRQRIGQNAFDYVANNRLERFHSLRRYEFYVTMKNSKNKLRCFAPAEAISE